MPDLSAWVLTGGKASRLGFCNKGLIEINGVRLIDRVINAVLPITETITFVGAENTFPDLPYGQIADTEKIGPLGGISAALEHSKTEYNLILSMDLPFLTSDFLAALALEGAGKTWLVPRFGGREHMLCSVARRELLPFVEKAMRAQNYKLRDLLEASAAELMEIREDSAFYSERLLFNLNSFDDLEAIE